MQTGGDRLDVVTQNHKSGVARPRDECLKFWPIDSHAETTEACHTIARLNSPIQARVTKDAVLLDLRTVPSNRLDLLREGIETALNEEVGAREQS